MKVAYLQYKLSTLIDGAPSDFLANDMPQRPQCWMEEEDEVWTFLKEMLHIAHLHKSSFEDAATQVQPKG